MVASQRHLGELNAAEMLSAFSDLEFQVAHFYERLAEMFDDDPPVSKFWLEFSGEETGHAEALRCAAESLPLLSLTGCDQPLLSKIGIISRIEREIKACEIVMTVHYKSLDAAFRCALFLESSELNQIYQWLLENLPRLRAEARSEMGDAPDEHILRLCRAIVRFGQDEYLRRQARGLQLQWEEYSMR
jgi:hypothetical protein